MFLPTTAAELENLGWANVDIVLVTGDTYIDSPYVGVSVIGQVLLAAGYKVGIIAQPDLGNGDDIRRLGEPTLFWGITAGCMDSMVSNYTATRKKRNEDDLTAGGRNQRRPDLAVIAYSNLVRKYFKSTRPIIIGGMEASLRRVAHYHYWSNSIRRSILFDAKADILVYGMGEKAVLEIAAKLKRGEELRAVRGICYASAEKPADYLELPSFNAVAGDKEQFAAAFRLFYANNDHRSARGICQQQDTRFLVQNPPQPDLTQEELDRVHELEYEHDVHPYYRSQGETRALTTLRFSVISHRGCYGQCHFCSIAVHQGQTVISRSEASIIREVTALTKRKEFKGIIQNVGGPTANMYGSGCPRQNRRGTCSDKRCLAPEVCSALNIDHSRLIGLLRRLRELPGVKKVFVGSGIRHDLVMRDKAHGKEFLEEMIRHHISGQLKLAPEHSESGILRLMGKPDIESFLAFKELFETLCRRNGKKLFLTCYFMAAYPGCREADMHRLHRFIKQQLGFKPQQVQIFTPTPASPATLMYYLERSWEDDTPLFVEKDNGRKTRQKREVLT